MDPQVIEDIRIWLERKFSPCTIDVIDKALETVFKVQAGTSGYILHAPLEFIMDVGSSDIAGDLERLGVEQGLKDSPDGNLYLPTPKAPTPVNP